MPKITRRRFASAAIASTIAAYGYATRVEPHWVEVTNRRLRIASLPPNWVGKTLVHVSDLHLGVTDQAYLRTCFDRINQFDADVVVVTGDFIDHHFPSATRDVMSLFGRLRPGKLATVGCLGNHDYGFNWSDRELGDRVAKALSASGVEVLRHQTKRVAGLSLVGLDDIWSPNIDHSLAHRILRRESADGPVVCLCHNPDAVDFDMWDGVSATILAGHTHGGQCKPPFLPPPRLPIRNRQYVAGMYELSRRRTLTINRGLGYGFRARFNCRPEITVFELDKQSAG